MKLIVSKNNNIVRRNIGETIISLLEDLDIFSTVEDLLCRTVTVKVEMKNEGDMVVMHVGNRNCCLVSHQI